MDTFGEYSFKIREYESGKSGYAELPMICNYMQEAAVRNAGELGFSRRDFAAAGEDISWVLTKMRVRMERYPKWGEEVRVGTFPRGGRKIVSWRDYIVSDGEGNRLGVGTTEWVLMDLKLRKILAIPERVFAAANTEREPVLGLSPFTRIAPTGTEPGSGARMFVAQNSHIDMNGHVNNVHYIEWMLEPTPGCLPRDMEIVFRSETFAGERVFVEASEREDGSTYRRVFAADGKEHIVAVTR